MIELKKKVKEGPELITLSEFLESYNKNMPDSFPRASAPLLKKFQDAHATLFTHGDLWSLDQHRKKIIDWLPRNSDSA
ncbi:MAG: hypothetical protein UY07_C0021G0019 [Parcubacteria group bacterium GW2011_GWA1_47_8]|nr:MAG: hypothetical protein UY07_C0021G0019 [Parcubacteria group bacterium GW2011_GWA1_47_8]KKW08046.1 MAG: hypothetical protein UY42_C0001G0009 [Parcubacteria group bacterium GW2011_GWA2_49_16]